MADEGLHTWSDARLLEWLPRVNPSPQSREAVEFEIQRRLAQRQLETAQELGRLTNGLRYATWALVIATAVLVFVTAVGLLRG